jgi:hypothetical protein
MRAVTAPPDPITIPLSRSCTAAGGCFAGGKAPAFFGCAWPVWPGVAVSFFVSVCMKKILSVGGFTNPYQRLAFIGNGLNNGLEI